MRICACLISWLGACLQVRCPVWRLQLTKEHNTRTPHKRAQHTHATQKEMYGYYARYYQRMHREGGGGEAAPPLSMPPSIHATVHNTHTSLFVNKY